MTVNASRPGPRTDLDARTALIDTAERMFGRDGVGSVSLRAIGREAGISSAGVAYHFTAKPSLVREVVLRRSTGVAAQMSANLQSLADRQGPVPVRDFVDAVLMPMVDAINADPVGGLCWMKIILQLVNSNDPAWQEVNDSGVEAIFRHAAVRSWPNWESDSVRTRLAIAMYSMIGSLAAADQGFANHIGPEGLDPEFVEQLAQFTTAGISH